MSKTFKNEVYKSNNYIIIILFVKYQIIYTLLPSTLAKDYSALTNYEFVIYDFQ